MNFIYKETHSRQIQKNKHDTELKLRSDASLTAEELLTHLSSAHTGLTNQEVENRQDEFGKNVITTGNKNTTTPADAGDSGTDCA